MKNWLDILHHHVELDGRREVAEKMKISRTTLSQVLNGKYPGNEDNIIEKVLNTFTDIKVVCPVLGEIPAKRCDQEQIKPFQPSNPQRIKLYKACQRCPKRK